MLQTGMHMANTEMKLAAHCGAHAHSSVSYNIIAPQIKNLAKVSRYTVLYNQILIK